MTAAPNIFLIWWLTGVRPVPHTIRAKFIQPIGLNLGKPLGSTTGFTVLFRKCRPELGNHRYSLLATTGRLMSNTISKSHVKKTVACLVYSHGVSSMNISHSDTVLCVTLSHTSTIHLQLHSFNHLLPPGPQHAAEAVTEDKLTSMWTTVLHNNNIVLQFNARSAS